MVANNITRLLDSQGARYKVFELPEEKLSASETADRLQITLDLVYKTIVLINERTRKYILAIVPGNREVDLKSIAATLGEKKIRMTTLVEAEKATGLKTGGISPLALLNKGFKMLLDESASSVDEIHISGGQRGLNIRIRVDDLLRITHATLAAISRE